MQKGVCFVIHYFPDLPLRSPPPSTWVYTCALFIQHCFRNAGECFLIPSVLTVVLHTIVEEIRTRRKRQQNKCEYIWKILKQKLTIQILAMNMAYLHSMGLCRQAGALGNEVKSMTVMISVRGQSVLQLFYGFLRGEMPLFHHRYATGWKRN